MDEPCCYVSRQPEFPGAIAVVTVCPVCGAELEAQTDGAGMAMMQGCARDQRGRFLMTCEQHHIGHLHAQLHPALHKRPASRQRPRFRFAAQP